MENISPPLVNAFCSVKLTALKGFIKNIGFNISKEDQCYEEYVVDTERGYYLKLILFLTDFPFIALNSGQYSQDVEVPLVRQFYINDPDELKFVLIRTRSLKLIDQ